jgi:hypothetical protein
MLALRLQSRLYLEGTILERLVSVKEKLEEFAIGRLLMESGFINPYDRPEISSSQTPQPRKASALRAALCAACLNAANRAPLHRHRRWGKGRMTTAPESGRSSSFGQGTKKQAQKLFALGQFREQALPSGSGEH